MIQYETKPRTPFQKFKLVMELFEKYAEISEEQSWLEVVVFEIPRMTLHRQDQEDLTSTISIRVPVKVEFHRTVRGTIQITVQRLGGRNK